MTSPEDWNSLDWSSSRRSKEGTWSASSAAQSSVKDSKYSPWRPIVIWRHGCPSNIICCRLKLMTIPKASMMGRPINIGVSPLMMNAWANPKLLLRKIGTLATQWLTVEWSPPKWKSGKCAASQWSPRQIQAAWDAPHNGGMGQYPSERHLLLGPS